jgi:Flp pilus assembly protein TadG
MRVLNGERGSAILELALITPLLVLLLLCAFDFGRVFFTAMSVSGAAHAGASFGSQSLVRTLDAVGMRVAAELHAPDLGITASASRVCRCGAATVSCSATCGTPPMKIYATVTATRTFTTAVDYPGIPGTIAISRTAQMRAQ